MGAQDLEMTAGNRGGDCIGSRFDAVGDQIVTGVVEGIHALHQNSVCSLALNAGSHASQTEGKIANLGIACSVQDLGLAGTASVAAIGMFRLRRLTAMTRRYARLGRRPSLARAWM